MARAPILPANKRDPTGMDRLERGAMRAFVPRLRRVRLAYIDALHRIPATLVTNKEAPRDRYVYRLDAATLGTFLDTAAAATDAALLEGGSRDLWFFRDYVQVAYTRGTAQEFANLSQQSAAYKAGQQGVSAILRSDPYRRRIALVAARVFEGMKGLASAVKADLARVLTEGIGRGLNPREVAKNIEARTNVSRSRANRIARTEITTALRRARLDEAEDAQERYGLRTLEMHISALSPSTRPTHAARHGHLFSVQQQRDWWAEGANSINCFVAGTKVRGRFVAGSKAQYRGDVIEIVTAGGRNLAVTPNHPIMTTRGFIAAAKLSEGDDLIAHVGEYKDPVGVAALHSQLADARIDDVFGSLVDIGHVRARRVSAVDFHGDARFMDEDIDVVDVDRVLTFGVHASLGEFLDDFALKHADFASPQAGTADQLFGRSQLTADGIVSRACTHSSKLRPEARGASCRSLTHGSLSEPVFVQVSDDCDTREADLATDLLDGLPAHVHGVERFSGVRIADKPEMVANDTASRKPSKDSRTGNADGSGYRINRFAGLIETDKVVYVGRRSFCGHVYDLQEVSGLMFAGDILTSNCKCSTVTTMVDEDGKPIVPAIQERALENMRVMRAKGKGPWAKQDKS